MGGGPDIQTVTPTPPPAPPSAGAQLEEYIQNYPKLVQLQQQYNPELAGLDYQLFNQYAPQYTQTAMDIQNQMYPKTGQLQENLAGQALQGMNEPLPDAFKQQYMSDFNAGIGMNANAPLGISDRNIGLARLQKEWQDYYRNLGLSVAQRQPLQQTANPTFQNAGSQENINPYMSYGASTYGSYANAFAGQNVMAQPTGGGFSGMGAMGGAMLGNMVMPGIGGMIGGGLLGGFGR